ncbi:MAG TPA: fumarylacetoacetate hydrolase family protein, partial [Synergistaceae bacterium]|nr:fumarylacetoacetate hydrolase family protein [Synergistaceae bacterium]
MRIATIFWKDRETAAVLGDKGYVPLGEIFSFLGKPWTPSLQWLLENHKFRELHRWFREEGKQFFARYEGCRISPEEARYAPLYRRPPKIWGIGLNYVDHAADLAEKAPNTEPASFMKTANTVIGYGDAIRIPLQSSGTTAEAELGVVFGDYGREV